VKNINQKLAQLFLFALVYSATTVTASERWIYSPVSVGGDYMLSVIWGDGQFVAVGKYGVISTSPDGNDWTVRNIGLDVDLSSIAWSEEAGYIVMGDSGRITFTSADGISWVKNETHLPVGTFFVGYAGGKYFASSPLGSIFAIDSTAATYYSLDGVSWEIFADFRLNSIAYGNDVFVGILMGHYNNILISSDGEEWEYRHNFDGQYQDAWCWLGGPPFPPTSACYMPSPPMPLKTIAYGSDVFLVGGESYGEAVFGWSEDGIQWNIPWAYDWEGNTVVMREIWRGSYHHIIYDGVRFVIVKSNGIYSTTNGRILEQIYNDFSKTVSAIASDGDANIILISEGGELGLLTKDTSSASTNPKRTLSRTLSGVTIRQNSKTLRITLSNSNKYSDIAIFNLAGKRQKIKTNFHTDGTVSISLTGLATGSYVLRVGDGRKNWQRKIIVK
jgi:hypothetical protein